jgi:hypothetical protein
MPPNNDRKRKSNHPDKKRRKQAIVNSAVARLAPTVPIPPLTVLASPPILKPGKKWCFEDLTPVYHAPDEPWPSTRLSKGTIVEITGQKLQLAVGDAKTSWAEVAYKIADAQRWDQWVVGWINDAYLDDYKEKASASGVAIPNPTPDAKDARQYMIWEDVVRYNLCGEFCVAFIVNDDIDSVLTKWKAHPESSYSRILGGSRDSTTSVHDLKDMLEAISDDYGYDITNDQLIYLNETLTYPVNPTSLLETLQKMLKTHYLISGVMINTHSAGELVRKDSPIRTGHWIVLDRITRNGNRFEIYNPFFNRKEEYSFAEFYYSFSTNSGLWVKRKESRSENPVAILPKFQVTINNPNPTYSAAQYIDVEGRKKTKLCGQFCVAFILKEPIDSVLQRWKEVQPFIYATIVGGNQGTGTAHLETILRAYGYNTQGDFTEFTRGLTDLFLKRCLVSPGRIAKMLKTHFLIAGVNIDGRTGRLKRGNDVPHWVVVDKLTPLGKNMGWLEIYNPFQNCWEEYSYREFTNAIVDGYWSGLWVKRSIVPVYTPQVVIVSNTEDKPWKDVRTRGWTEQQLDDVIRQKIKAGRPIQKIPTDLAELSGWRPNEIRRRLKAIATVGNGIWTDARLRTEIKKQLQNRKSIKKISPDQLARISGWNRRDVKLVFNGMIEAAKWSEQKMIEMLRTKLQAIKAEGKIADSLLQGSGWRKPEILSQIKKLKELDKWTEEQVRREIESRLATKKHADKVLAKLVETSGWRKPDILKVFDSVLESRKWTGPQVLDAIRGKLKTMNSADKVLAEVIKLSGWNRQEINRLVESQKWTAEQVCQELERQLNIGRSIDRIKAELSLLSGWKKPELSKRIKGITEMANLAKRSSTKRIIIEREPEIIVDPETIVHASKPLAEFMKWQDSFLSNPKLYRVRRWGDPIMVNYGFDVNLLPVANFQAVGLYNDGNNGFGAVSNYIRVSRAELMRLKAMQIEDEYEEKREDWRAQKMNWLCKRTGTIYLYDNPPLSWRRAPQMRWGTLALGGNLVQVVRKKYMKVSPRDGVKREIEMAELKGFTEADWGRPLDELLAEGLVHRCFCVYSNNKFVDTPKGIIYSPFFSPWKRDFAGKAEATALYIPTEWLEDKNS